jgi:general secretion pathway protein J
MKRRAPDGFTLLELLLAISLLSLITASIMGGVHLGRRSWETTRASDALDEIESAMRAATGLVAKSFAFTPEQAQPNAAEQPSLFLGTPTGCRFVALSEGGAQYGGLILTEIGVENRTGGAALVVWTKVYRPKEGLSPDRAAMKKTVVLTDLTGLELSYFGSQQLGSPPAWNSAWNSATSIPALVSIKFGAKRLGRVIDMASTVALRQQ